MKVLECKGMFDCTYVVCVCYLLALYIHMYEYFYLRVCIFIMFICMYDCGYVCEYNDTFKYSYINAKVIVIL